jgi:hypothetical protein
MLVNANFMDPLLDTPIFSIIEGDLKDTRARHRFTTVASMETLWALAPAAITDGA